MVEVFDQLNPISFWPLPEPFFMSSRYCKHDLLYMKFVESEPEEWIVLGKDDVEENLFTCIPKTYLQAFFDVDNKIQEIGAQWLENGTAYQPFLWELCTAKINDLWYRCECVGICTTGILMYAFDYGVVVSVAEANIRVS